MRLFFGFYMEVYVYMYVCTNFFIWICLYVYILRGKGEKKLFNLNGDLWMRDSICDLNCNVYERVKFWELEIGIFIVFYFLNEFLFFYFCIKFIVFL